MVSMAGNTFSPKKTFYHLPCALLLFLLEYFSSLVEVFLCAATAHAEISLRTDYVCENNQMVLG